MSIRWTDSHQNLLQYQFETDVNVKDGGFADDDEILLNIDTELQQEKQQHSPDFNKIFESSKKNIIRNSTQKQKTTKVQNTPKNNFIPFHIKL